MLQMVGPLASSSKHSTIPAIILDRQEEKDNGRRKSCDELIQVYDSNHKTSTPIIEIKRIDGEVYQSNLDSQQIDLKY